VLREKVFSRIAPVDPLYPSRSVSSETQQVLAVRYTKFAIEGAAIHIASAGDHLANAHVRLAWEANAATPAEIKGCGFDPTQTEPRRWTSVGDLCKGLKKAKKEELGVLAQFVLSEPFLAYANNEAVRNVVHFRHQIVHRERPSYREDPALGRTTLWAQPSFAADYPYTLALPSTGDADETVPRLADQRLLVGEGLKETLIYAKALWEHTLSWLRTIDVNIRVLPTRQVQVTTQPRFGYHQPRFPRKERDPGPFLQDLEP
jgi:hypothetical protein